MQPQYILAIESSCDDTSAAVMVNDKVLANVVATQEVHKKYGGVVPELASRAHQQNIVPVVDTALREAGITKEDLHAIAYTRGPGLLGSLLVGSSFSKAMSIGLGIPLIEVNHMQAHILAHFIKDSPEKEVPEFPFICLTVSGGHTQLVLVKSHLEMEIIGETMDDAAGEAFDKTAKIMGLPYPGGPYIDKYAAKGNPQKFEFAEPKVGGYDFSFSGFKTSFLYFLKEKIKSDPAFIQNNVHDLCASVQQVIINILLKKLIAATDNLNISTVCIAGGVSANTGLRTRLQSEADNRGWKLFIPPFEYCTDNAAMIGITGYFKLLQNDFSSLEASSNARMKL